MILKRTWAPGWFLSLCRHRQTKLNICSGRKILLFFLRSLPLWCSLGILDLHIAFLWKYLSSSILRYILFGNCIALVLDWVWFLLCWALPVLGLLLLCRRFQLFLFCLLKLSCSLYLLLYFQNDLWGWSLREVCSGIYYFKMIFIVVTRCEYDSLSEQGGLLTGSQAQS